MVSLDYRVGLSFLAHWDRNADALVGLIAVAAMVEGEQKVAGGAGHDADRVQGGALPGVVPAARPMLLLLLPTQQLL